MRRVTGTKPLQVQVVQAAQSNAKLARTKIPRSRKPRVAGVAARSKRGTASGRVPASISLSMIVLGRRESTHHSGAPEKGDCDEGRREPKRDDVVELVLPSAAGDHIAVRQVGKLCHSQRQRKAPQRESSKRDNSGGGERIDGKPAKQTQGTGGYRAPIKGISTRRHCAAAFSGAALAG